MADYSNPFASAADDSSFDDDIPQEDEPKVVPKVTADRNNPFAVAKKDGGIDPTPGRIKRDKSAYKSQGAALILFFITGLLGGHNYYVGRYGAGVGQLVLFILWRNIDNGFISFVLGVALFIWLVSDFIAICRRDLGDLYD